jgi:hypothetical protein
MSRTALKSLAACLAAAGVGGAAYALATPTDKSAAHSPPGPEHSQYIRRVGSGEHVPPADNPGAHGGVCGGRGQQSSMQRSRPPLAAGPQFASSGALDRCKKSRRPAARLQTHAGVRVFPDLLTEREAAQLVAELQPLKSAYGINLISPAAAAIYRFQMSYLGQGIPPVNMLRVTGASAGKALALLPFVSPVHHSTQTARHPSKSIESQTTTPTRAQPDPGRPEQQGQARPPWGYGNDFDESYLPPALRQLAGRIRRLPGLRLGRLRDVTINYRRHQFYRSAGPRLRF